MDALPDNGTPVERYRGPEAAAAIEIWQRQIRPGMEERHTAVAAAISKCNTLFPKNITDVDIDIGGCSCGCEVSDFLKESDQILADIHTQAQV